MRDKTFQHAAGYHASRITPPLFPPNVSVWLE